MSKTKVETIFINNYEKTASLAAIYFYLGEILLWLGKIDYLEDLGFKFDLKNYSSKNPPTEFWINLGPRRYKPLGRDVVITRRTIKLTNESEKEIAVQVYTFGDIELLKDSSLAEHYPIILLMLEIMGFLLLEIDILFDELEKEYPGLQYGGGGEWLMMVYNMYTHIKSYSPPKED